jgi:hypothetical protein
MSIIFLSINNARSWFSKQSVLPDASGLLESAWSLSGAEGLEDLAGADVATVIPRFDIV